MVLKAPSCNQTLSQNPILITKVSHHVHEVECRRACVSFGGGGVGNRKLPCPYEGSQHSCKFEATAWKEIKRCLCLTCAMFFLRPVSRELRDTLKVFKLKSQNWKA